MDVPGNRQHRENGNDVFDGRHVDGGLGEDADLQVRRMTAREDWEQQRSNTKFRVKLTIRSKFHIEKSIQCA
jgi:hypothetical protein